MITNFESHLLLQMRSEKNINSIILKFHTTHSKLKLKSKLAESKFMVGSKCNFNEDSFKELGPPISEHLLTDSFSWISPDGTKQITYNLNIWPKMVLRVNKHPDGHYWGVRFHQLVKSEFPIDTLDLNPWEWTLDAIAANSIQWEELDHWDWRKDIRFTFVNRRNSFKFIGEFDIDLLQNWFPDK